MYAEEEGMYCRVAATPVSRTPRLLMPVAMAFRFAAVVTEPSVNVGIVTSDQPPSVC
jgi:hypothetical protein